MSDQDGKTTTVAEIKQRSDGATREKKGNVLASMSASLGNEGLMERLQMGNDSRDDLLDFIVQRLADMRNLQLAEVELSKVTENSYRTMLGASGNEHEKPDPQRWIQAANLYQDAARALCSGNLHRGNELLDQAVQQEQDTRENLTKLVDQEHMQFEAPQVNLSSDVACTDCPEPDGLQVADHIQAVTTEGNQNIKGERRELDPWWTDLEEEEEEEENG